MNTSENVLQNWRTPCFIGELGVTVGWMRLISINGPDETHNSKPLRLNFGLKIANGRFRWSLVICVIKRINLHLLDHNLMIVMCFHALHLVHYKFLFNPCALMVIQWTSCPLRQRTMMRALLIRRLSFCHVPCTLKNRVELSPTWVK